MHKVLTSHRRTHRLWIRSAGHGGNIAAANKSCGLVEMIDDEQQELRITPLRRWPVATLRARAQFVVALAGLTHSQPLLSQRFCLLVAAPHGMCPRPRPFARSRRMSFHRQSPLKVNLPLILAFFGVPYLAARHQWVQSANQISVGAGELVLRFGNFGRPLYHPYYGP